MRVCRESHLAETAMHLATLRKPIRMVPMFRPVRDDNYWLIGAELVNDCYRCLLPTIRLSALTP